MLHSGGLGLLTCPVAVRAGGEMGLGHREARAVLGSSLPQSHRDHGPARTSGPEPRQLGKVNGGGRFPGE